MAALSEYAARLMRDTLCGLVRYFEITDSGGGKLIRIPLNDRRVSHSYDRLSAEQLFTICLKGDDADLTLPCTIGGIAAYESAPAENALFQSGTQAFRIESAADFCEIAVKLRIPSDTQSL